jgi:small GTP-binding protein
MYTAASMLRRVLPESAEALLREERGILEELRALLARLGARLPAEEALQRAAEQLDELFLLVVVGEFNSGKSALINALLGLPALEEGVTPTTSRIALLRHGPELRRSTDRAGVDRLEAPVDFLRELVLVDTPGTNAVLREHETVTRDFVPRCDLVLFVTSADRPFTESERSFLQAVREWGKRIVVVVNKVDLLEREQELAQVVEFVRQQTRALLGGAEPQIFPVSARRAARAKAADDPEALAASGLPGLEAYLLRRLDQAERLRLKLLSPIGVGQRVLAEARERVEARLGVLEADFAVLADLDSQLELHSEDLSRDFRLRLSDVDSLLLDFERRGHAFFEETLRLGRVFELLDRERLRDAFETKVVAELPRDVERRVEDLVDWMVSRELRLWQDVMERLQRRQAAHADRMLGRADAPFEHDRRRLLDAVRREAHRAVEGFDHQAEARRLAASVRDTVAGGALLQVGAVGLGAAVAALATTTLADVTGVLAAGALSVIGLLLLPARRRAARAELRATVVAMRERLLEALTMSFRAEQERARARLVEALGPYSRFVRGEGDRLRGLRDAAHELGRALQALRARIGAL